MKIKDLVNELSKYDENTEVFCKIEGCENRYIRDIGNTLFDKYGEQLKDIIENGNSV